MEVDEPLGLPGLAARTGFGSLFKTGISENDARHGILDFSTRSGIVDLSNTGIFENTSSRHGIVDMSKSAENATGIMDLSKPAIVGNSTGAGIVDLSIPGVTIQNTSKHGVVDMSKTAVSENAVGIGIVDLSKGGNVENDARPAIVDVYKTDGAENLGKRPGIMGNIKRPWLMETVKKTRVVENLTTPMDVENVTNLSSSSSSIVETVDEKPGSMEKVDVPGIVEKVPSGLLDVLDDISRPVSVKNGAGPEVVAPVLAPTGEQTVTRSESLDAITGRNSPINVTRSAIPSDPLHESGVLNFITTPAILEPVAAPNGIKNVTIPGLQEPIPGPSGLNDITRPAILEPVPGTSVVPIRGILKKKPGVLEEGGRSSSSEVRFSDDDTGTGSSNRSTPAAAAPALYNAPAPSGAPAGVPPSKQPFVPKHIGPVWGAGTGRGITLGMLMQDDIIKAGEGVLTINYLGRKFVGDLLDDGRIQWQETKEIFSSPSAWAIHCKKLVNPAKKSGCGWASVKYKGQKLDVYKSSWFRKHNQHQIRRPSALANKDDPQTDNDQTGADETNADDEEKVKDFSQNSNEALDLSMSGPNRDTRDRVMPFTDLGKKGETREANALVQCATFPQLGRSQPYTITMGSNCMLVLEFHAHLTTSEIVGYLGGRWDEAGARLVVEQAFPCRARLAERDNSLIAEEEVRQRMEERGLVLVGWYHSHSTVPQPSIKDIESQYQYQLCLRGFSDVYHPCIGLIVNPYPRLRELESKFQAFCIVPPFEVPSYDYCFPVDMSFTEVQDEAINPEIVGEMRLTADFYRGSPDVVKLSKAWEGETTYFDKLKACLTRRVPPHSQAAFIHMVQVLVQQYL